jgi:hypothetical protein
MYEHEYASLNVRKYFFLAFLFLVHRQSIVLSCQINTLKNARSLCSTITQKGANLHELLGKELDARVRISTSIDDFIVIVCSCLNITIYVMYLGGSARRDESRHGTVQSSRRHP